MKTHLLRLGSVVPHGVGGPEAGLIDLLYSLLLQEFELNVYNHIQINQIGNDLEECILKDGKNIHINIRYPVYPDYELKSVSERNYIRLDIVHVALAKIADYDNKLQITKLEAIRKKIVDHDFSFDFVYKTHINKKIPSLVGKVIIHPKIDRFDFYISIEEAGNEICRLLIYSGKTTDFYFASFFFFGKWETPSSLIIKGKEPEIEFHILIDQCKVKYKNLTKYEKPPYFEMMKADLPEVEKRRAYKDWIHSLPPGDAGIINFEPN